MSSFKVFYKETTNPTILKFEVNAFITKHQSYEFNNIDDAKPSPLAQQLFHLPFVKKVYISSNFVAIERYDIISWEDVQEEVAQQIEAYLNNKGVIITEEADQKKISVTII